MRAAQLTGQCSRIPVGRPRHRPAERWTQPGLQRARSRNDRQDLSARGLLTCAHERRSQALPWGRASVLLVEDEPAVRAVARQVLEACGYTVITASSGEEALERCLTRGLEPDLLITDVVMPGLTGSQLVAHLRSHRDGLRVLYTSGFTEDAVVHHGVASGGHFLSKPFTPADLAHKVREVLGVTDDLV